ncbi:MAG: hypothetical protein IJW03_04255 [Clostridia bacterium]|nr:hypothetical protein [Clostridia bacterium]
MKATKFLNDEVLPLSVSSLPTHPTAPEGLGGKGYTSADMKAAFDKLPLFIIERFNALIDDIESFGEDCAAASIPTGIEEGHTLFKLFSDVKDGNFAAYLTVGEVTLLTKLSELEAKISALEEAGK